MITTIGSLTRFAAVIEVACIRTIFKGFGPFTVFAPSDQAYGAWQRQASPEVFHNVPRLTALIGYHVLPRSRKDCTRCTALQVNLM